MGDRDRAAAVLDEAEALLAACRDPGLLPARLAGAAGEGAFATPAAASVATPATVTAGAAPAASEALSEREVTVLRMLTGALSEREIGQELYLSFNTVHSHVKAIYRKLGVSSRAEAVARAREERLIQPRPVHLGEPRRRG